ncbi:MAG: sigma-70 family RNA polymerase sigma factor, partial [Ruminococcus sp.]|nr:sigma-70 family RNA polymerase sigma factor [Ruminococcus sp.]
MDNREIDRLYKEHRDGLYRYVLKIVGSRELAEDITEDAFLRSVEKHGDLKETAAFRSWLYTIAYRKCLDCINEQKRTVSLDSDGGSAAAEERARLNEPLRLPEDYAVNEDTKRRLGGLIEQLKPSMRSAVMLYYYDGLSMEEVAKRLGISSNAASQLLFRARRKLKKQLERLPELSTATLCALPLESIISECAEGVSVPAVGSRVSVTPLAVKVIGAAAAVGLAVGIPLGLSAAR